MIIMTGSCFTKIILLLCKYWLTAADESSSVNEKKKYNVISSLYVCMANTIIQQFGFMETPRKFIIVKLSMRKLESVSSDL